MLGRTKRIHLVGIGGSGMNGIAELLFKLGYAVSGSDARLSAVTERLASMGLRIHEGHAAGHVGDADVVVFSSAIDRSNPEVVEAALRGIPVIPRAEMLAELMRLRFGVAVAGAHGKTTTTSMIALVLERGGLDPTAVIGGRMSTFGSSARLGKGDVMVIEADESDRSFLRFAPAIAVLTNIDQEHLEAYGDSFDELKRAFAAFAGKVPFYGAIVACVDDPHLRRLVPGFSRRVITYGLTAEDAQLRGSDVRNSGLEWSCSVAWSRPTGGGAAPEAALRGEPVPAGDLGRIVLHVPGRHNLQNALAAVAVGLELQVPFDRIVSALAEFRGAERRFESHGEVNGVLVIEDYGHHPTEIAAVLRAAREALGRRLVAVFQPHRYTRTVRQLDRFGPALADADEIVLTGIYAAGEPPDPTVTVEALADSIRRSVAAPVHLVGDLKDVPDAVARIARPGDVVVALGAGSIGPATKLIVEALSRRARG